MIMKTFIYDNCNILKELLTVNVNFVLRACKVLNVSFASKLERGGSDTDFEL